MTETEAFNQLEKIYDAMPQTICKKTTCAMGCCTKLESFVDKDGNFMPLPLVYGVEYVFILRFLEKKFGKIFLTHFDFSRKTRTCPFKDKESHLCLIYPVRPFTCRVYGRKVPPVLAVPRSMPRSLDRNGKSPCFQPGLSFPLGDACGSQYGNIAFYRKTKGAIKNHGDSDHCPGLRRILFSFPAISGMV